MLLITAGIVILLVKRHYEKRMTDYQNKLLWKQIEEVHGIYQTMRGWRHDYHNHLQTLKATLALGQVDQAREYLDTLEKDLTHIRQIAETGNVELDAILNSKLSLVKEMGIALHYKAQVPAQLPMTSIDLCVLLGNLIDNAVEACEKVPEEKRFFRLYLGSFQKQFYISASNATTDQCRKTDQDYISRKRGNHGHGLLRMNRVVDKYNGYINRKNEPGVFVTEIMIPYAKNS